MKGWTTSSQAQELINTIIETQNKLNNLILKNMELVVEMNKLKEIVTTNKNLLRNFENLEFENDNVFVKINWVKSKIFDSKNFKIKHPELYNNNLRESLSKKLTFKFKNEFKLKYE